MTKKSPRKKDRQQVHAGGVVTPEGRRSRKRLLLAGALVALLIAGVGVYFAMSAKPPAPMAEPPVPSLAPIVEIPAAQAGTFVGARVCQSCHGAEFKAWSGSHHDRAMQEATVATMLGNFADVKFTHKGVETTFFKRGDKFMVRTDGPDGRLADYEISHTFGVYPLQQYLIPFPGGRYQVLPIAWDSRDKGEGGQRWFHLQPDQKIDPKDPFHWTGRYQNWALQCAECHSTNLRKGYDAASDNYRTTYSEINVACEACHGQGSKHVEWAARASQPYAAHDDKGLPALNTRWSEAWKFPSPEARFAVRDRPADPSGMNTCAACHARRSTLSEDRRAGAPLEDSHRLAMLTAPNYHADGQQREEVYVWGSFLQSKMFQNGVTCMDCHEPHSQKLRAEGNALCARCHNAAEFDTPKHHRHLADSKGAQCVNCHMPTQNYMVIHARPDHSIRLPRPDLSVSLGSPNACTQCHTDKQPEWAASALDKWHGRAWRERPHYGQVLHAGATQGVLAMPGLLDLASNPAVPAIVRASAATLAQPFVNPDTLPAIRALLKDADPSVRIAALGMLSPADPVNRVLGAAPLLDDPVKGVRIEAARILADLPDSQILEHQRAARQRALQEYEASLALDADWPSANLNLGNLRLRQGRVDEAVAAYQRAIKLDPYMAAAYISLADALRQQKRDAEEEAALRQGLAILPHAAELHHALGLMLARRGKTAAATTAFVEASRLEPNNTRYAYVQAIALHSAGKREEALAVLRDANRQSPNDLDVLSALISINRESGDNKEALRYAKQALELLPGDDNLARLVEELEGR